MIDELKLISGNFLASLGAPILAVAIHREDSKSHISERYFFLPEVGYINCIGEKVTYGENDPNIEMTMTKDEILKSNIAQIKSDFQTFLYNAHRDIYNFHFIQNKIFKYSEVSDENPFYYCLHNIQYIEQLRDIYSKTKCKKMKDLLSFSKYCNNQIEEIFKFETAQR